MNKLLTITRRNTPTLCFAKILALFFFAVAFTQLSFGQKWTQIPPPSTFNNQSIIGVHFVNNQIGYICGAGGMISKTEDCGATWTNQTSKTTSTFYSIFFTNSSNGVAVGDNGTIRVTIDGGINWNAPTSVPANSTSTGFRVVWFYSSLIGYIGGGESGSYGRILKTIDGGLTWTHIVTPQNTGITGRAIYGVYFTSLINGYATDFDGRILRTVDGGSSWTITQATAATNQLAGIHFTSNSTGYAVGGNGSIGTGIILKTEDAGLTWNTIPPFNTLAGNFLTGIKFVGTQGYAVGGNLSPNSPGVIYKTTDTPGSNTWIKLATPDVPVSSASFGRLYSISLPTSTFGYTCGLNGTLLKTPIVDANFTFTNLTGNCLAYQFTSSGANTSSYAWDFGDSMSGANNTSTQQNPTHQFSKCGVFKVCLTASAGGCNVTVCKDVTIIDNTPPIITCPLDKTLTCGNATTPSTTGTATATDNCTATADISITYTEVLNGIADCDQIIRRTWTAKDKCGNTSSCLQTIFIRDNIKPVITNCPQNTTVNTNQGQCTYTIPTPWTINATDNCDPNPTVSLISYTSPSGGTSSTVPTILPKGINTFVYQAKDKCNNLSNTCTFTITVIDTEKPKITCPGETTLNGTNDPQGKCKASLLVAAISVTDNCPMVTYTYNITGTTIASGTGPNIVAFMGGTSTVTLTATDMSGNTATCSFKVIIICNDCKCGTFSDMIFRPAKGAMNFPIKCGDTLNVGCEPTFNPIIGGLFQCMGNTCSDSALVNWVLNSPSNPNIGSGNLYAKPNFSLALLGSYFNTSGTYELVFTGVCNGVKCPPCKFYFKVDCFCPKNYVQNPKFDITTGSLGDEQIGAGVATDWGGIWPTAQCSTGDIYNTVSPLCPGTSPTPISQGNFASFWVHKTNPAKLVWREGIMNTLNNVINKNSDCYKLSFKLACTTVPIRTPYLTVYGINATGLATGICPVSNPIMSNFALFPGNTSLVELGTIALTSNCTSTFKNYDLTFNSSTLSALGITHIFLTRNDLSVGLAYVAVDDFCLVPTPCNKCECKTISNATVYYTNNSQNPVPIACNNATPVTIPCKKIGPNFFIHGDFPCAGQACGQNVIYWEMTRPTGQSTLSGVIPVNYSGNNPDHFDLNLPWSEFSAIGNYSLTFTRFCGEKPCKCTYNFKVDCPCDCTKLTEQALKGFVLTSSPASCSRLFRPFATLCSTDKLQWTITTISGTPFSTTASSIGTTPVTFNFPSPGGVYNVCFLVTRYNAANKICAEYKYCKKIVVKCPVLPTDPNPVYTNLCPTTLLKNGDFSESTSGILGENASIKDWGKFTNPGTGQVFVNDDSGAFDDGEVTLIGGKSNFAGIFQKVDFPSNNFTTIRCEIKNLLNDATPSGTVLDVRLQESLASDSKFQSIHKFKIENDTIGDFKSFGFTLDGKIDPAMKYIIFCVQSQDDKVRSMITIDNIEVCTSSNMIGVNDGSNRDKILSLHIYPNPNSGSFTVELPVVATPKMTLRITDLTGRLVSEKPTEIGVQLQNVDTTTLPNGLYFLQVVADGKTIAVEKFVKQ